MTIQELEATFLHCPCCKWAGSTPQVLSAHVKQFHPKFSGLMWDERKP